MSIGAVYAEDEDECLSSTSGSMLASGVEGETTAVLSDVFALDDAPEVLTRLNCLKLSGAWMTDGGASSESALRTVVLSL